jgi:hypothetical protein
VRTALNLGVSTGSTGAAATFGALNLTNGIAQIYGATFGANSSVAVAGGILVLTNPAGTVTAPLGTLVLAPVGTPDNSATLLSLPVRTNSAALTVNSLAFDGIGTTTNVINIESVGPVGSTPVELPLIQYGTRSFGGTFNIGLGTLPSGYAGYLVDDTANNQISLMLTSAIHPQPLMTSTSVQGANLVASGVNGFGNVPFTVLTSTDVSQPVGSWTVATTGIFAPNGTFSFTVPVAPGSTQQFFRVRVP